MENAEANWQRLSDTAEKLGTTEMRVLMLLKNRHLKGVLEEGEWRIEAASVKAFLAAGPLPLQPAACQGICQGCRGH